MPEDVLSSTLLCYLGNENEKCPSLSPSLAHSLSFHVLGACVSPLCGFCSCACLHLWEISPEQTIWFAGSQNALMHTLSSVLVCHTALNQHFSVSTSPSVRRGNITLARTVISTHPHSFGTELISCSFLHGLRKVKFVGVDGKMG